VDHLSFSGKRWALRSAAPHDSLTLLERLRSERGITDDGGDRWDDGTLFPDAAKAAARVRDAIKNKEVIGIFGDYDCDGVTGVAQLVRFFRRNNTEPVVRLPHRVTDGYGLKKTQVDEFQKKHVTLLITVDTGISAGEAILHAKKEGIDVIILDHHHVREVPDAFAILHPALAPDFPAPHPSAAGVVFLFLCALENGEWKERATDLTLATFGTVADLVPLRGINRRLVQEGLKAMQSLPDGPVKHLVDALSRGKTLTSVDIAFRIAPRINAAGRMGDATLALHAMLDGGEPLTQLEKLNVERQQETLRSVEHALETLDEDALPPFLAVADASYKPGIIGLIAGKLTERFGRPSMAATINGDVCTASFRSPAAYDVTAGLTRVSGLLQTFGGHAQAAGATFALDHYMDLCVALEEDVASHVKMEDLLPRMTVDALLTEDNLTRETVEALALLEPYGQGNPEPLFLIQNVRLEKLRSVGGEDQHLQASLGRASVIGFGKSEWMDHTALPVDILCRLGLNTWNDKTSVQLMLVDMRFAKGAEGADGTKGTEEKTRLNALA
jgi:single-stranded-DNA-specific exonuclease